MRARPSLPDPDDAPSQDDWARPLQDRQLEVLSELTELGLQMARNVARQAAGEEVEAPIEGDLPLAFSRVSRATRMAVLLQARLIQEIKGGGKAAAGVEEDDGPVRLKIRWLGEPDDDEPEDRGDRAERSESERAERLEREDFLRRPTAELIGEICGDLGVDGGVASELKLSFPLDGGRDGMGVNAQWVPDLAHEAPPPPPYPEPSG